MQYPNHFSEASMRIGLIAYPKLFRQDAAVQRQVRECIAALLALRTWRGVALQVELLDASARLADYDLIHAFSATHGNGALVEAAAALGVPVVLSPLVSPGWDRESGALARMGDRRLATHMGHQSGYAQTRRALQVADRVLACGATEKAAIRSGFLIDAGRIRVCQNGISAQFFDATGARFRERSGLLGPFVLMAAPICPYMDQLSMAQALADLALPFVLIGEARGRDHDYLRQVRAVRGVTLFGHLGADSALLASAVAAASVYVLPRNGGAAPLTAHDALACGTPVVFGAEGAAALVNKLLAAAPGRAQVRALVRSHTWQQVAGDIAACYVELVGGAGAAPSPVAPGVDDAPEAATGASAALALAASAPLQGGFGRASASYTAT